MIDKKIPASFEDVGILFGLTITFAFLNRNGQKLSCSFYFIGCVKGCRRYRLFSVQLY